MHLQIVGNFWWKHPLILKQMLATFLLQYFNLKRFSCNADFYQKIDKRDLSSVGMVLTILRNLSRRRIRFSVCAGSFWGDEFCTSGIYEIKR